MRVWVGNACSDTVSDGPIPAGSCDSSGIRLRSEAWVSLGASPRRAPQKERLKIPRTWLPQDGSHLAQRRIGAAVLGMASKLQLTVWVDLRRSATVKVRILEADKDHLGSSSGQCQVPGAYGLCASSSPSAKPRDPVLPTAATSGPLHVVLV